MPFLTNASLCLASRRISDQVRTQTRTLACSYWVGSRYRPSGLLAWRRFQRGLTALTQWVERKGQRPVPRGAAVDVMVDGETVPVRLGAWLSNTKSSHGKLTTQQLTTLTALGMEKTA
ncbi:Helicase associated domain protein [Streptomyces sp. NPDC086838]|uniref:Helicase associated domain protein n=1 Tax=Streptomyces sp. NPDC086838 TaxID=3365762 RepID=UPI0038148A87